MDPKTHHKTHRKTHRKTRCKTSRRKIFGAAFVPVALLLILGLVLPAGVASAADGAATLTDLKSTVLSWIDSLAERLTASDEAKGTESSGGDSSLDEAGVDIEPNG